MSPETRDSQQELTKKHLRGSSLLLVGRLFALAMNFLVQVVTVRYLAKSDFGAFGYALAAVSMGSSVILLGLNRAVNRLVPIALEKRDYGRVLGTIALAIGNCVGLGLALIVFVFGAQHFLAEHVVGARPVLPVNGEAGLPLPISLLLILIALSPAEALDSLFQGLLASLASPRAIFFRRHVLTPCMRLGAVLGVVALDGDVTMLATFYLVVGLIGVLIYVGLLYKVLRERGLLAELKTSSVVVAPRELYALGLPMFSTDIFLILKTSMAVLLLEPLAGANAVADFQAVIPMAGLNLVVLQSLKMLYTPTAARLFARGNESGINAIFWQSAVWIALITFPVFAVCILIPDAVTALLFGDRYVSAANVLVVLAIGNYVNAALGMNTYTLQVYARVRTIAATSVLATLLGLGLNLWLIPEHGALGAAMATSGAVVAHNVMNHIGLFFRTGVDVLQRSGILVYGTILVGTAGLIAIRHTLDPHALVIAALIAMVFAALLWIHRGTLAIADTFPELARVPLIGRLVTSARIS
jgi:O-antigen/teichoic acid export membrane protein